MSNYRYELRPDLSPKQVADLRTAVGWDSALPLYRRTLGRTFAWAGAFVGDQLILIAYGDVVSDGIADAYVRDLVVHPDHQRQGVGSHLLALLIEAVRGAGVRMVSTVFEPGLATFYRKAGFHVVSGGLIDLDPPANALGRQHDFAQGRSLRRTDSRRCRRPADRDSLTGYRYSVHLPCDPVLR